jgi:hypothetical protein
MRNEFGGGYDVKTDLFWKLAAKYSSLPIAEKIAWEATQNEEPSDCESDEVCAFFVFGTRLSKYLGLYPNGEHAAEAVSTLADMVTDDVIRSATGSGGDRYAVQTRTQLRPALTALRVALGKTSAPGREALLRKIEKVK